MVTDGYPIERDTLTMDTSDSYRLEHLTSPYRVGKPPLKRFPFNNIQQSDTLRAPTPLPPLYPRARDFDLCVTVSLVEIVAKAT